MKSQRFWIALIKEEMQMKTSCTTMNRNRVVPSCAAAMILLVGMPLAAYEYDVADGDTVTESAALGGAGNLTKTGAGRLILDGANKSYTGGTFINGGSIQIATNGANIIGSSATSAISLDGGALYADFLVSLTPGYVITVGASGGEIRLVNAGTGGRWTTSASKIAGAGTLALSFGGGNARYHLNASQPGFTGKWVLKSEGNSNKFFDMGSSSGFGNASGDDAITMNRSYILLRNNITLGSVTQGITLTGGGISRLDLENLAGASATIAGKISGAFGNTLELSMQNAVSTMTLSNTGNTWAGETSIRTTVTAGGRVRLGASGVIPDNGGNVIVNAGMILDLNGFDEAIGGLNVGGGRIQTSTGPAVLTVGGNNNSPTFTGTLEDGGGVLSFTKVGSGLQSLSGTNTYSGNTLVSSGTLKLNASGSISNTPLITIASGATVDVSAVSGGLVLGNGQTLAGQGTVVGALKAGNGAVLSPGSSTGILTTGNLTLGTGSVSRFEINGIASPGTDYDRISSSGSLTYQDGWILEIQFGTEIAGTHTIKLLSCGSYNGASAPQIRFGGESGASSWSFNNATGELTFRNAYDVREPGSIFLFSARPSGDNGHRFAPLSGIYLKCSHAFMALITSVSSFCTG